MKLTALSLKDDVGVAKNVPIALAITLETGNVNFPVPTLK